MIGFFDSGYGGLLIMQECLKVLPKMSAVYFGDNARAPYGSRTEEEIFNFTVQGVKFLFGQGCDLVILACNTASANALRRIQQEIVPQYPGKNVLGILVPTVEQISGGGAIGVFATPATVASHAYAKEIAQRNRRAKVVEVACPELVPRIEAGANLDELRPFVQEYADEMKKRGSVKAILLGCTHYPLIRELFAAEFPQTPLYDQGAIVARSLQSYLERHPQYVDESAKPPQFFTSGDPEVVREVVEKIFHDRGIIFTAVKF